MRLRRLWSCILLALALAGPVRSAAAQPSAQPSPQEPTVAQAEEQVRKVRETLHKDRSAPPESWGGLMMAESMLIQIRAQQAGGQVDAASLQEQQREMRERVFAEWKAARPDEAMQYLLEMQSSLPPEKMDDAVLGLVPRGRAAGAPDSPPATPRSSGMKRRAAG